MKKRSALLETVPGLILFFLFALCMLMVLLSGAGIYKRVTAVMDEQYSLTTCVNYISAKVRHYDREEGIAEGCLNGAEALILYDNYEGEDYATYLYCYDGYLMELFCAAEDNSLSPEAGQEIMPLDRLEAKTEDSLLFVSCGYEDKELSVTLNIHSLQKEGGV